MKKAFLIFLSLVLMTSVSIVAVAEDGGSYISIGEYNETVKTLHQKLADFSYFSLRPESPWSVKSVSALKQLQYDNGLNPSGTVEDKGQYEAILAVTEKNKNLIPGCTFEWSDWMTPEYNGKNKCFTMARVILADKQIGDQYNCSLEIEFNGVNVTPDQKFGFKTQGAVDESWEHWSENIWNTGVINLTEVPADEVYVCNTTSQITENTVNSQVFSIGFRCDYWSSGSFRIRNMKVEKGTKTVE